MPVTFTPVEPRVYLVAETKVNQFAVQEFLTTGITADWAIPTTEPAEQLVEIGGRLCYKSFDPNLNLNITRVRKDSKAYLENIIRTGHGSVLEHASLTFILTNVSRTFTHELVRHRAGTAFSQESLRYVRVEDLGFIVAPCIEERDGNREHITAAFEHLSAAYEEMRALFPDLDDMPFAEKKIVTSALRAFLPHGLATSIMVTANIRAWRWIFELRSDPAAEVEFRELVGLMFLQAIKCAPLLFGDLVNSGDRGYPVLKSELRGKV